ncbi:DUF2656 domain-containing protein [Gloeobacter violaceus]|uniref:Glr2947 protein n=1 Tax=Gloeobacter violaceus (strain ATCC 29082 / PCC 7421) TaxID=251221 RepID=Q7NCN1_GLOVI|nr:DUF2656 domain-containing protein [Gloeobacter violaceus]BAC90888.1 glr2947 [Gloeobacter violaceus PCC 7421]
MTEPLRARMLLSHNFDTSTAAVEALSPAQFAQIFTEGLAAYPDLQCRCLEDSPHWLVEIYFPIAFTPRQVGELCGRTLAKNRAGERKGEGRLPDTLILGGLKTTPALGNAPYSLRPGEWGVDVVETDAAEAFLTAIGWEATVAGRPTDTSFKFEIRGA